MEYINIKNADKIISESKYFVKDPYKYKNKWHDLFGNKNPISLELGMGRGDFIINMAKKYPCNRKVKKPKHTKLKINK